MAAVRSKNTRPEMALRKRLHAEGFRYRLYRKDLPGNPDIVLPKYRMAVCVHGCFWHGHDCKDFRMPASNVEYWTRKIERNGERDRAAQEELSKKGWRVKTVWTCRFEEETLAILAELRQLREGLLS
jgi:DNA mismatch endonuclease (patch repair protein)